MLSSPLALSFVALALFGAPVSGWDLSAQQEIAWRDSASIQLAVDELALSDLFEPCRPCPHFGISDLKDFPETVVRLLSRGVYLDGRVGDHPAVRIQVRPRGSGARVRVALRF